MSVNKVILVGNVGADPEIRYLDGGTAVCTLRMATSESYRSKEGERITQTEWHNVVLWRSLAEITEKYVKKGSQIYIEGRLKTRTWDDKDGNKRYTTDIVADTMRMLDRRGDGSSSPSSSDAQSTVSSVPSEKAYNPSAEGDKEADDLPF